MAIIELVKIGIQIWIIYPPNMFTLFVLTVIN